ncbi:ion transporter [Nitrospinae bacterium]|nr:ion transporter [Nitrospinota bacterium]|tara:strand:+ start:72 stop:977 length:906 start_codon:yes stop_codon:yes gene_type:complete
MQQKLKALTESKQFQIFFIAIILLSGLVVGLDSYPSISAQYGRILNVMDSIILWLFVFEILLKMVALGGRFSEFFKDGWNTFDFIIVSACFLPFDGQSIIVLRLLRVLRVVRLVGTVPELKLIVNTLLKSIPSMGYIAALLSILFYIYACLGTFLFRANDPIHFESLHLTLLSLFRVATLEDWTDIMYTAIYGCQQYGYSGMEELCKNSEAFPFLGWLYFVSFVLLATFVFLNLIIGVIINNMEDLKEEEKYKLAPKLEKIDTTEANMKILLNRIKKDMALLETHVSFLDDLEKRRLKEKI